MEFQTETSERLASFIVEDAEKILSLIESSRPQIRQAINTHPEGMRSLCNLVLQVSRVQTICAHERPVDLELFTGSIQEALDAVPVLKSLLDYFIENPDFTSLNPGMDEKDAQAANMRFQDYVGSFLI